MIMTGNSSQKKKGPVFENSSVKKEKSMDVRLLHNHELWNKFVAQQLGQYSYQTFEWGEYLNRHGHIIFRLGAFVEEQLTGVMLLAITSVPLAVPFSLLNLKWMYCYQGPCVTGEHPGVLEALLAEAHAIAKREQAVMMRVEAPSDMSENDAYLWHCTLQRLRYGLNGYASDWAKAQGVLHYEMYTVLSGQHKPANLPEEQAHAVTTIVHRAEVSARTQVDEIERRKFGPVYDFVYRPLFYRLWTLLSHGHLPCSAQVSQQMQQQIASATTVPLHL
jgi:hypothetical protein